MSSILQNLEKMIGSPRDGALLRFSIGNEYLKQNDPSSAARHFVVAVEKDPKYSAAWKQLGRALADCGRTEEALDAWKKGIEVAEARGDKQAAKEMSVFARRLEKKRAQPGNPEETS